MVLKSKVTSAYIVIFIFSILPLEPEPTWTSAWTLRIIRSLCVIWAKVQRCRMIGSSFIDSIAISLFTNSETAAVTPWERLQNLWLVSAQWKLATTGLNNPPEKKKSAGRSVDAMFYIVVTLITPQSFKIRPLQGFEKIAFFHFFTYDG